MKGKQNQIPWIFLPEDLRPNICSNTDNLYPFQILPAPERKGRKIRTFLFHFHKTHFNSDPFFLSPNGTALAEALISVLLDR